MIGMKNGVAIRLRLPRRLVEVEHRNQRTAPAEEGPHEGRRGASDRPRIRSTASRQARQARRAEDLIVLALEPVHHEVARRDVPVIVPAVRVVALSLCGIAVCSGVKAPEIGSRPNSGGCRRDRRRHRMQGSKPLGVERVVIDPVDQRITSDDAGDQHQRGPFPVEVLPATAHTAVSGAAKIAFGRSSTPSASKTNANA